MVILLRPSALPVLMGPGFLSTTRTLSFEPLKQFAAVRLSEQSQSTFKFWDRMINVPSRSCANHKHINIFRHLE